MTTDKQESPKESGRYMISNDDHPYTQGRFTVWSPALYNAEIDQWSQYNLFYESDDGMQVIDKPARWQSIDQTIKDLGYDNTRPTTEA